MQITLHKLTIQSNVLCAQWDAHPIQYHYDSIEHVNGDSKHDNHALVRHALYHFLPRIIQHHTPSHKSFPREFIALFYASISKLIMHIKYILSGELIRDCSFIHDLTARLCLLDSSNGIFFAVLRERISLWIFQINQIKQFFQSLYFNEKAFLKCIADEQFILTRIEPT